ncbi:glycosyltransferase family 39 protein, partial [Sphingomonas bacterium]|uniref:glycosyltransferase family 39 protein n=1 Tax=Sphingomonas bacterium TaxID=1895847 RepID=UPI001575627D
MAIAIVAALIFILLAGYFATLQNVWVDESTQLLGSALPPGRMIAWLAGHPEPLGVPPDRMPPVSYAIDALCGRSLCGTVLGFRLLHMAIAAAAIAALVLLAAWRYGWLSAVVAGALLTLTPQMVQTGVEIRAYPLFFAATILQIILLYRLIEREPLSSGGLIAFALAGVLAIYTHFFGVISSSALFSGLIAARARSRREALWIGGAWALVLLSAVGIAPFVMGASAISQGVENGGPPTPAAIATFLLRIIGHSSMMLHPALVAIFCLALGLLLLIAALR